jgi:hypothetical protein
MGRPHNQQKRMNSSKMDTYIYGQFVKKKKDWVIPCSKETNGLGMIAVD